MNKLLEAVGKYALAKGESWRVGEGSEIMDAYESANIADTVGSALYHPLFGGVANSANVTNVAAGIADTAGAKTTDYVGPHGQALLDHIAATAGVKPPSDATGASESAIYDAMVQCCEIHGYDVELEVLYRLSRSVVKAIAKESGND